MFTWVPFYKEIAEHVLKSRNRQSDLIAVLQTAYESGCRIFSLNDRDTDGNPTPLKELDPFTFFASFNRQTTVANRLDVLSTIKDLLGLSSPPPTDLEGLPVVNNQQSWFFPYGRNRAADDIPTLWELAETAFRNGPEAITPTIWDRALQIHGVALPKLTIGLFWLAPDKFLPLDRNTKSYLTSKGVVFPQNNSIAGYLSALKRSKEIAGTDFLRLSHDAYKQGSASERNDTLIELDMSIDMPDDPLNLILYGPPGTGKTYATIERAVRIIDGKVAVDALNGDRFALKARYDTLVREGRIGFVTFHQSYSYEDFVEGIRPAMDEDSESARYECRAGILKEFATRALAGQLQRTTTPSSEPQRASFGVVWQQLLDEMQSAESDKFAIGGYMARVTGRGNIEGWSAGNTEREPYYNCGRSIAAELYSDFRIRGAVSVNGGMVRDVLGRGAHYYFIAAIVNELFRIERQLEEKAMPEPSSDGANLLADPNESAEIAAAFLRDEKASGYELIEPPAARPRYVLIIDEINRGNISKILGELITLLEDDKRLPGENTITVTLPYSREMFALPANLYILGTMNTADKSIAMVDVALRRRFDFEELTPDFSPTVCPHLTPAMRDILEELNRRITMHKDRDHRIGHAFFVRFGDEAGFNRVFKRKVAPLLQEYFYGDWEGLRYVLGESGSDGKFVRRLSGAGNGYETRNAWQWHTDVDDNTLSALRTLAENYGIDG